MKRHLARALILIGLAGSLGVGCYTRTAYQPVVTTSPTGETIVTEAPPPLRHEVIGVAPSAEHVWINGYWTYHDHRWVWLPGHYELRPRTGATWVAGHWDSTTAGWVWRPGHWE